METEICDPAICGHGLLDHLRAGRLITLELRRLPDGVTVRISQECVGESIDPVGERHPLSTSTACRSVPGSSRAAVNPASAAGTGLRRACHPTSPATRKRWDAITCRH